MPQANIDSSQRIIKTKLNFHCIVEIVFNFLRIPKTLQVKFSLTFTKFEFSMKIRDCGRNVQIVLWKTTTT